MLSSKYIFKQKFYLLSIFMVLFLGISAPAITLASVPYDTYSYDWWAEDVLQPHAYLYEESMNIGLKSPQDMFWHEHRLYVADTGNSRVIILSEEGVLEFSIDSFMADGNEDALLSPQGVFVTEEGHIYVADSGNSRIIEFFPDGTYIREISRPETDLISNSQAFTPTKVVVDNAGRIYCIAYGINLGLVEFNKEGIFQGFLGATPVTVSAFEYIWKNYFSTKAQKDRMQTIVPTEYSNIFLDNEDFIYATISNLSSSDYMNGADAIRRLNPTGTDILRRLGNYSIIGDLYSTSTDANWSVFVDVCATKYGCYFILDSASGKVHAYDYDGNSLFIFGSKGNRNGNMQKPTSIAISEDESRLYILDSQLNSILTFSITEYGSHLLSALRKNSNGDSDGAYNEWQEVLRFNANSEIAYLGIGKTYLREGDYTKAMEYFKLSNSRKYYTKAFKLYRKELMQDQFAKYMGLIGLAILVPVLFLLYKKFKKWVETAKNGGMPAPPVIEGYSSKLLKRKQREQKFPWKYTKKLTYGFHVIFHPFDGFWDLKREKRGSFPVAVCFILLTIFTFIIQKQNTAFLFNFNRLEYINALVDIITVVLLFTLWCAANWCLTSLMDGKGTMKDIAVSTGYSLIPFIMIQLPLVLLSYMITSEEGTFYNVLSVISYIWVAALIFLGTMITHQYSVKKTIATVIFTLLGMAIIMFIALLFFSVIQQIVGFVSVMYKEIRFR